jgi:hypothetical protein
MVGVAVMVAAVMVGVGVAVMVAVGVAVMVAVMVMFMVMVTVMVTVGVGVVAQKRFKRKLKGELIMTQLSRSAQAKLAADIAASVPAKEWDQVPEIKKFREEVELKGGKKRLSFGEMVNLSIDLKAEIEYRERIRKEIQTHIEAAMLLADETEVMWENYPVQLITRAGSRKIVPEKLLEQGVPADVIAKATVISAESTFAQIGKPKKDR